MKFIKFFIFPFLYIHCFAGGYIEKGGHIYSIQLFPSATNVYTDNFFVVCIDTKKLEENQDASDISNFLYYVPIKEYHGGCEQYGESSQFYLFHLFPTSGKINPEYAITTTVQKLEGDTMINIRSWQETHYYTFIGQVIVFKVKGDVIKFQIPSNISTPTKSYDKQK